MIDLITGFHPTGWQAFVQSALHTTIFLTLAYGVAELWEFHKRGLKRLKDYDLRQENK